MPPILSVAPFDTVIIPPAALRFAVNAARSNVPLVTDTLPEITALIASVAVPAGLLMTRLLNAVVNVPPILCAADPLIVTVPLPAVKAAADAVLIQFPPTLMLKLLAFRIPAASVRVLFTVIAAGNSNPLVLLTVKLPNVVTPEKVC